MYHRKGRHRILYSHWATHRVIKQHSIKGTLYPRPNSRDTIDLIWNLHTWASGEDSVVPSMTRVYTWGDWNCGGSYKCQHSNSKVNQCQRRSIPSLGSSFRGVGPTWPKCKGRVLPAILLLLLSLKSPRPTNRSTPLCSFQPSRTVLYWLAQYIINSNIIFCSIQS